MLNDSLSNNPFNYKHIKRKLKYGIHKINISSKIARISTEKNIFLFPNQHISIEFFPADTLLIQPTDTLFFEDGSFEIFSIDSSFNYMYDIQNNEVSVFQVESSFNPFYLE
jgi:hypothetical protein